MLSQGHVGAPLYRYTGQVVPRFGNSRSLREYTNGAITSQMRLISSSDCYPHPYQTQTKCLSYQYAVSRAYGCTPIPLYQPSRPPVCEVMFTCGVKQCHNIMVEADINLRPLHTSILDICKMFEPLVCCLKGIWVHPYTVTPAKLAPDFGVQVHLWSENDVIITCLRLISTSNHFIHPY